MTPSARAAAAIAVLDRWLAGEAAEQALTNWGRASRFAGSGDRAAVRDLVFDAMRCRRSFAARGGGETSRGLILGGLRAAGLAPELLFTGEGHAPAPLSRAEAEGFPLPEGLAALDCPDWLAPRLQDSLGADFASVMELLRHRAPVFLRANLRKATRDVVQETLAGEGIAATPHPLAETALEVTENARKIKASKAYLEGLAELQDAASQAVAAALPLVDGQRVLDFCAGGGGKTLAMAGLVTADFTAHDADPARMRDLPERARRAGARIRLAGRTPLRTGFFDLVVADAPCSGSGSWRRAPEAKWALTPARLDALCRAQDAILTSAAPLVAPGGALAYATCSLLRDENADRVAAFRAAHPEWVLQRERRLTPLDGGDGFYLAVLTRDHS